MKPQTTKVVVGIGIVLGLFNLWMSNGPGAARYLGIGLLAISVICGIAMLFGAGSQEKR